MDRGSVTPAGRRADPEHDAATGEQPTGSASLLHEMEADEDDDGTEAG